MVWHPAALPLCLRQAHCLAKPIWMIGRRLATSATTYKSLPPGTLVNPIDMGPVFDLAGAATNCLIVASGAMSSVRLFGA